jgi:transposase
MMGRRGDGQGQFFYSFDLDEVVPPDHMVHQIDAILDLSWVHKELAPYYSHTGRPSIDPVLMIRMLLVGYVFAIRSERQICSEVQVNLAYRWFCKLNIEDGIPDHSVFCRARHERFRESQPVVPEDLDQLAVLAPEDVKVAGMRVALQRLLDA